MDKKTATLTLTEKLRENSNLQIVSNQFYQKSLIEKSLTHYQIGDTVKIYSSSLCDNIGSSIHSGANYFFIENIDWERYASGSSFAIIGEEEVRMLRERFYKDVPHDVENAMAALDIKSYVQLYEMYSNGSIEDLLRKYELYSKLGKCFSDLFSGKDAKCLEVIFDGYMGMTLGEFNQKLKNENIQVLEKYDSYIYKGDMSNVILAFERSTLLGQFKDLLEGFIDLVFVIPDEDQNLEVNKFILGMKNINLDYNKILIDEYNQGKHFKDYFGMLNEEQQKKVVKRIKNLSKQNMFLNSWLFSRGFTLELNYIKLYEEDTEKFIDYFKKSSLEIQELIVSDLLNCEFTNSEVIGFLEKEYSNLLRDVTFKEIPSQDIKNKK